MDQVASVGVFGVASGELKFHMFRRLCSDMNEVVPDPKGQLVWCEFKIRERTIGDLVKLYYDNGKFYDRYGEVWAFIPANWAPSFYIPSD